MTISRVFPVFSIAFAVIYIASVEYNLALFTYHPEPDLWGPLVQPPKQGPAMYWYGWLATSALGATAVSLLTWPLARRWPAQFWLGWIVPLVVIVIFIYFFRDFFIR